MVGSRPVYVEILPFSFYFVFVICCLFEVFQLLALIFGSPKVVKSFQSNLFDHKLHTEHILYSYISRRHQFRELTFSLFFWTKNNGKHNNFNSQYLACLPLFNPYIHTICSLWVINPTKSHLSTIYPTSQYVFSPKKIVDLWRHNKSWKKHVPVLN